MERRTAISLSGQAIAAVFSRRTRRLVLGSLSGAALLLAGAVGCTGWSADTCDQYLLCVSATMPLAQSDQIALYGKDGTCWSQIDPEQCARACKASLKALAANTTAPECHPSSGSDTTDDSPPDMMSTAFSWPLPVKSMFYSGPTVDPMLTGTDPVTGDWLCTRDDMNPLPPSDVRAMAEPNELPEQAVVLSSPLPIDPPSSFGTNYEICPDRSAPSISDFDTYKFTLTAPAHIISEIKYQVKYGDLDISLFSDAPAGGQHHMTLIGANLTGKDNGCIEHDLTPGTYYLVVYGARDPMMQTKTAMNRYQLRVFEVQTSGYTCS